MRLAIARYMLGCALSTLAAVAHAQVDPANVPGTNDSAPRGELVQGDDNNLLLDLVDSQQRLREQLADPGQRAAIIEDRRQQQRRANPDLGRLLQLDAATEQKLLTLLVDQQIAAELRAIPVKPPFLSPFVPSTKPLPPQPGVSAAGPDLDLLELEAADYDQHILAVGKILSDAQVGAYLDYVRLRSARASVEQFNRTLSAEIKLSNEQKDALVPVFAEDQRRTAQNVLLSEMSVRRLREIPQQERWATDASQRSQLFNTAVQEELSRRCGINNRELLQRVAPLLTREQAAVYAKQLAQQLTSLRDQARRMRRALGIAADQVLEPAAGTPQLPASTQLELRVRINGTELTRTVTSKHGAAVTLEGPVGMLLEVQPSLSEPDISVVELKFYEPSGAGQRLVGQSSNIGVTGIQQPAGQAGVRTNRLLLLGRKAYLVDWNVSVTQ